MDLAQKLLIDVIGEAKKHRVSQAETHRVFFEAYEEHKAEHGSLKHSKHYVHNMNERYRFMHQTALDYIEEHKQR